jgi:hypothetical protein
MDPRVKPAGDDRGRCRKDLRTSELGHWTNRLAGFSLLLQTEFLDGRCHVVKRLFDYASKLL